MSFPEVRLRPIGISHSSVGLHTSAAFLASVVQSYVFSGDRVETTTQEKMSGLTMGMPMPPGFKLPF